MSSGKLNEKQLVELEWWARRFQPSRSNRVWATQLVLEVASEALSLRGIS